MHRFNIFGKRRFACLINSCARPREKAATRPLLSGFGPHTRICSYSAFRLYFGTSRSTTSGVLSRDCTTLQTCEIFPHDAGKKVKGRKRHILVDTLGLLLNVVVRPADAERAEQWLHKIYTEIENRF